MLNTSWCCCRDRRESLAGKVGSRYKAQVSTCHSTSRL